MSEATSDAKAGYPPFDVTKPVAENVWIVDGRPLHKAGLAIPVRMIIIGLGGGDLILYSPTRYDPALHREIEALGPIRHLVAPSFAHWMFVAEWQKQVPHALTWAVPGLKGRRQVRTSGLRIDRELGEVAPVEWTADISHNLLHGGFGYAELALFHKPSRTLVVTDLVQAFEPDKLAALARFGVSLAGVTAPEGGTPRHLRILLGMKREAARTTAERLVALDPERVIFAHGDWFRDNGRSRLRGVLDWLLG